MAESLSSLTQNTITQYFRRPRWEKAKRVAWIRTGAVGDCVVGLASLAEMTEFFPNAKITVVGPRVWLELISPMMFPAVERIVVVDRRGTEARLHRREGETWGAGAATDYELHEILAGHDAEARRVEGDDHGVTDRPVVLDEEDACGRRVAHVSIIAVRPELFLKIRGRVSHLEGRLRIADERLLRDDRRPQHRRPRRVT